MRRTAQFTLLVAVVGAILTITGAAADPKPSVNITNPAPWGPGGDGPTAPISGTVTDAPVDAKVVVFAFAGSQYWIQPWGNAYKTAIKSNTWATETHLGQEYVALLVKPSFQSSSPLSDLPPIGADVLAKSAEVPGRK